MSMNRTGLTKEQVEASRKEWGSNSLTPPEKVSLFKLFLEKFNDPIIRILLVAAVMSLAISFAHGDFTETIGIIVAIALATGVGFWFEVDASRKFDALNSMGDQSGVRVLRDGKVVEIEKCDVVVGDVVYIETGEEIAADGTLFESVALNVNESSLTGEPAIFKTTIEAQFKSEATYPSNMVLRGTTVLEGSGAFVVEKVGDATEIGKVAKASTEDSGEKTPLTIQLDKLAKMIGVAGFSVALLTFFVLLTGQFLSPEWQYTPAQIWTTVSTLGALLLIGSKGWKSVITDARELIFKGKEWAIELLTPLNWAAIGVVWFGVSATVGYWCFNIDFIATSSWVGIEQLGAILNCFMIAVTMIVVAVPEGLPMSVTLSLALNMRRMLKSNNLVRKMHACETMGAINTICTDKTGTLTQNQMSVSQTFFSNELSDVELIYEAIAVNSTAHLDLGDGLQKIKTIGNPTESALLLWLHSVGVDYNTIRNSVEQCDRVPFSTLRKYMATKVKSGVLKGADVTFIKGAPEVIAQLCSQGVAPTLKEQLLECQNRAMRTLAFGYKQDDGAKSHLSLEEQVGQGGFIFLGFVAISDPVRSDVPLAVGRCLESGIEVKIVTGDTTATATEIARQIGLWNDNIDGERNHISGVGFEALSDEELLGRVHDIKIMSRARPQDKQRFVRLLQQTKGVLLANVLYTLYDVPSTSIAICGAVLSADIFSKLYSELLVPSFK